MNYIDIFLQEIAEAGIYAILTVLGFVLFYTMHKSSINRLEAMMKTSIEAIERSYKSANESLNSYIDKHNREHSK